MIDSKSWLRASIVGLAALLPAITALQARAAATSNMSPTRQKAEALAHGLIARMTLDEKLGQLVDGNPLVEFDNAPWGSLPNMKTVRLEKGHRYPLEVSAGAHGSAGVGLIWKRVSEHPEAELNTVAGNADVIVAVVGLTSNLEGEEFRRFSLKLGQAENLTFELSPRDLSSVTPEAIHTILAGSYQVSVGSGQPGTGVPGQSAKFSIDKSSTLPK